MKKKKRDRFKFVVAIDLGTFGTGVAFSSISNQRIHSISFSPLSQQKKTPTSIFIHNGDEKKSVFFGDEARTTYLNCPNELLGDVFFFQRFKMCLFNTQKTLVESSNGNSMEIVDVFTEALIFFKENIPRIITRTTMNGNTLNNNSNNSSKNRRKKVKSGRNIKSSDIRWVFTIPAILSNHAKGVIRLATERAGLGNSSFLVLEPECASVFLEESYVLKMERLARKNKNKMKNHFHNHRKSTTTTTTKRGGQKTQITKKNNSSKRRRKQNLPIYMVVDCGGGTVDITLQQVQSDKTLKNRIPPRGGPWGSTFIDREMIRFIHELLEWDSCPGEAKFGLLQSWEVVKRELFMISSSSSPTTKNGGFGRIPIGSILPFLNNDVIVRKCKAYNIMNGTPSKTTGEIEELVMYRASSASLLVSLDIIKSWFQKPINRICEEIASIVTSFTGIGSTTKKNKSSITQKRNNNNNNNNNNNKVDYLFLVGGFSSCPLLQNSVKYIASELNKIAKRRRRNIVVGDVIIPNNPGQCVLHGAVIMGLYPNRISTRISSKTYGIGIVSQWEAGVHPKEKRWVSPEGRAFVREVFCTYVRKGDEIDCGYVVRKTVIPSRNDQDELSLTIFESDDREVVWTSDPSVRKVQTILVTEPNVELPKHMRKILIEMRFGAESIVVSARNMVTGENLNIKCRLHSSMV